jgi:hypothetical protein
MSRHKGWTTILVFVWAVAVLFAVGVIVGWWPYLWWEAFR